MSRGTWKILNSWWLLLTFTMFFNWVAFLYIGITAKYRKWIYYGAIYSIPFVLVCALPDSGPIYDMLSDIVVSMLLLLWLISIFHAFSLRNEYLIRREHVLSVGRDNEEELRRKIEKEFDNPSSTIFNKSLSNKSPEPNLNNRIDQGDTEEPKMVDINNDSEQAIAGLPGVGIILAKRAIELRESEPFKSVDDFGEILGLKPHIIEQIRPLIVINVSEKLNEPETLGRVVDF